MHSNTDETKKIPLGSGKIYVVEYTGTIPADDVFETDANMLGRIQGGASLEYKPTFYTESDDAKTVSKTVMTDEEATMKFGIITWNTIVLNKLICTGTVTEANGHRTLKIGGLSNQNVKTYAFRFVNADPVDGDIRVTICGSNQAGITMTFAKDKGTAINPEVKAQPMSDGVLIIFDEEILGLGVLSLELAKGSTTGKTKVSTITPDAVSGNTYKYKIGSTAETVTYNTAYTTGWTALTAGTTEISATAGQIITVIEVNGSNKAVAAGTITVVDNIG